MLAYTSLTPAHEIAALLIHEQNEQEEDDLWLGSDDDERPIPARSRDPRMRNFVDGSDPIPNTLNLAKTRQRRTPQKYYLLSTSSSREADTPLLKEFIVFRLAFLTHFEDDLRRQCGTNASSITLADVSGEVIKEFFGQLKKCAAAGNKASCTLAFHGTKASNHSSIFQRGLLIPALHSDVKMVNGNAHGDGIYTSRTASYSLSYGQNGGNYQSVLVCAVIDDSRLQTSMNSIPIAAHPPYISKPSPLQSKSSHSSGSLTDFREDTVLLRCYSNIIVSKVEGTVLPLFVIHLYNGIKGELSGVVHLKRTSRSHLGRRALATVKAFEK